MNKLLLLGVIVFSGALHSQILDMSLELKGKPSFFDANFIEKNKIVKITEKISLKREGEKMLFTKKQNIFCFDSIGTLSTKIHLIPKAHELGIDSFYTYFRHYPNKLIAEKRMNDRDGYYSYVYEYNDKNQLKTITYYREVKPDTNLIKPIEKLIISKEIFGYENPSSAEQKTLFYNTAGKVYKEKISQYDQYGYLKREYTSFIIGSHKHELTYAYDNLGRLSEKTEMVRAFEKNETKWYYKYDQIGNIIEEIVYKNGKEFELIQYLYDKNLLLSAKLIKEHHSNVINIYQYQYEFKN